MTLRTDIINNMLSSGSRLTSLFGTATWFIGLMYSIVMIVSLIALIINIAKLAMSGGNPMARSQAIRNILIAGGCLSVLGGLGFVFYLLLIII